MVKHTQKNSSNTADELFECFDHFVGLALKGSSILQKGLTEDACQGPEYSSGGWVQTTVAMIMYNK